jgi:hypothetical protein
MMIGIIGMFVTFFVGIGIVTLVGSAVSYDKKNERTK